MEARVTNKYTPGQKLETLIREIWDDHEKRWISCTLIGYTSQGVAIVELDVDFSPRGNGVHLVPDESKLRLPRTRTEWFYRIFVSYGKPFTTDFDQVKDRIEDIT